MNSFFRDYFNSILIKKIKKFIEIQEFDIIWSFDPFRLQNLSLFKSPILIYHPADVHYTFLEKEIASYAHLILTTCEFVKKELEPYNKNVYNIGHGVSDNFFKKELLTTYSTKKLKVCMLGNLQRKIDYPILFTLIDNHPDIEFHFIGPSTSSNLIKKTSYSSEVKLLESFSNTYLHGSIMQEQLPSWLNKMNLFLILYSEDENPASQANPHKILEYLSTGKVILSSWMEEYVGNNGLIEMERNNIDIITKFKEILSDLAFYNSSTLQRRRIKYAQENTYKKKIKEIEGLLDS